MAIARMDRKANSSVNYLIAKYFTQYDEKILRSLHKLLGLKRSIAVLEHCSVMLKASCEKHKRQSDYIIVADDKKRLHSNVHVLKLEVFDQFGEEPGAQSFINDCVKQMQIYDKPMAEVQSISHAGHSATFDIGTTYMSMLTFHIVACVFLDYIYNLPQRSAIIKQVNDHLNQGVIISGKKVPAVIQMNPPQIRTVYLFTQVLLRAVDDCASETQKNKMGARADFEVSRFVKEIKDGKREYEPLLCYDHINVV